MRMLSKKKRRELYYGAFFFLLKHYDYREAAIAKFFDKCKLVIAHTHTQKSRNSLYIMVLIQIVLVCSVYTRKKQTSRFYSFVFHVIQLLVIMDLI
jgi:hypothetical protein